MSDKPPDPIGSLALLSGRSSPLLPCERYDTHVLRLLYLFPLALWAAGDVALLEPRVEYLDRPLAIETTRPRFSWVPTTREPNWEQRAYEIEAASTPALLRAGKADLWRSGRVESAETTQIPWGGAPLHSRQAVYWRVRVWDRANRVSAWSAAKDFSMGLLDPKDWQAQWISYRDDSPFPPDSKQLYLPPAHYFRKPFPATQTVRRAILYASALGSVDLYLNGARVSDALFTPGWSDYRKRAYYHAFDVTRLLRRGDNVLGAVLADGWYSGYVGFGYLAGMGPGKSGRAFYGKTPAVLVQLELELADGSTARVLSDGSWHVTTGPEQEADLLMGESYDARRELGPWSQPGYREQNWEAALLATSLGPRKAPYFDRLGQRELDFGFTAPARLQSFPGVPVRPIEELPARNVVETKPGVWIVDLGQNFSGVARLRVKGPAGQKVQLRFGEMLHPDGRLLTENLRKARATDTYILRGDPKGEDWTPRFTYHGFRYVEVTNHPGPVTLNTIRGVVIHSDTPLRGKFDSSDPMTRQLQSNIVWTQRSNFVDIPTDCPQRDERLGWTGDAQVYSRTATYNADTAAFYSKWLDDLEEAQHPSGAYPDYAPYPMWHGPTDKGYGTAWTDAGIIVPYRVWQVYGDTRVLERHWDSMRRFLDFRERSSPDRRGRKDFNTWGDWLSIGSQTPLEFIDAAYFAYDAELMSRMATALGKTSDAAHYGQLAAQVRQAFTAIYARPDGLLREENQTMYALALSFDLFPAAVRQQAADRLAQLIAEAGNKMTTGFIGTYPLIPVLSANGHHDLAVQLYLSREFPSWGYEVENGATTIWERWNSFSKRDGFFNPGMNSFSHYAFGAIGEWMFKTLAGIDLAEPGYRQLQLAPRATRGGLEWAHAEYHSIRGLIRCGWRRTANGVVYETEIPANTRAKLVLPGMSAVGVLVNGTKAGNVMDTSDGPALTLGSGVYRIEAVWR